MAHLPAQMPIPLLSPGMGLGEKLEAGDARTQSKPMAGDGLLPDERVLRWYIQGHKTRLGALAKLTHSFYIKNLLTSISCTILGFSMRVDYVSITISITTIPHSTCEREHTGLVFLCLVFCTSQSPTVPPSALPRTG